MFDDVDICVVVEKEVDEKKMPLPLVIHKVQEKSPSDVTSEIDRARAKAASTDSVVLDRKAGAAEKLYYFLFGPLRCLARISH